MVERRLVQDLARAAWRSAGKPTPTAIIAGHYPIFGSETGTCWSCLKRICCRLNAENTSSSDVSSLRIGNVAFASVMKRWGRD